MGKATKSEMKKRVAALKAMLLSGSSNSVCVAHASNEWGLSQRQSYRLLKESWVEIHEDVETVGVERTELISWAIHNLMAAAGDGIKHKQPSVTVGAVRELDALLGLGINSIRGNRHGWRR